MQLPQLFKFYAKFSFEIPHKMFLSGVNIFSKFVFVSLLFCTCVGLWEFELISRVVFCFVLELWNFNFSK